MIRCFTLLSGLILLTNLSSGEDAAKESPLQLTLRQQKAAPNAASGNVRFQRVEHRELWGAADTAIIVCDVWDRHHCLNAVRRMTEFLPRMNQVLAVARKKGAVIIHAPSDCMPAYESHPARFRAIHAPVAANRPQDVEFWCSKIPSEEQACYPIDQSDGGEDDDPAEHVAWAATLKAEGRNPGLPWKTQNDAIVIDTEKDYISDKGDEVWNILESRGIRNVILVGVHTNMCVLGRPFGLRQMVRAGKNVVLMRDLTDCMYNPKRWPWVDHFTGNDLIIAHVERFVCPTISSEQILGGKPHVSEYDTRTLRDISSHDGGRKDATEQKAPASYWKTVVVPGLWADVEPQDMQKFSGTLWLRCSIRLPASWIRNQPVALELPAGTQAEGWLNGTALQKTDHAGQPGLTFDNTALLQDGVNLLTLKVHQSDSTETFADAPVIHCGGRQLILVGRWQLQTGDDPAFSNIPLPAQFGLGPDVLFEAPQAPR